MIGSLYAGISGLKANMSAMTVIGDNIANVDTTGFKASRVSFANIFSATMGGSELQIGRGVTLSGLSPSWENGTLENTTNITDLSINGQGLFVVKDAEGAQFYTRAGKFEFNKDGDLVNQDGLNVQGYAIDTNGNIGALGNIVQPNGVSAPRATTAIGMGLNLDARAANGDIFDSTLTVYDSLGTPVELTIRFTYDAANTEWDWAVTPSIGACATTGSLAFNTSGGLSAATIAGGNPTLAVTGLPGANLSLAWNYLNTAGTASDGSVTGYAATSAKRSHTQDGFASGTLQGVGVDETGIFTGLYSNGTMLPFAQVALADFASYSGLAKRGSNLYSESLASGQALIGTPNTSGLGTIAPSTLEMANVDLATEFVDMITTQRAFQANAKVITSSDELLAELINIKR